MMLKVLAIFGLIYSVKSNNDLSVSSFPTNKYVEYIQAVLRKVLAVWVIGSII